MDIDAQVHRELGTRLFNQTWDLLVMPERTREQDDQMVYTAMASRYHWGECGAPVNFARGEWQISRVFAALNRPEQALHYARRSLETCQANGIGDFDLAFGYEAVARAAALLDDTSLLDESLQQARQAGEQIAEQDDRDYFFDELRTIPGVPPAGGKAGA
jgi:hypothetical protein